MSPAKPAGFFALLLLLAGWTEEAKAQALRCDLVGKDTTINGQPGKTCLDVSGLNNQTIVIPANVTRLDNDGFSLCQSSVQTGGNADIVYVYDNSGSMASYATSNGQVTTRAWVNSSGTDTVFYFNTTGCPSGSGIGGSNLNGSITFQQWNAQGTGLVSRTIPRLISNSGCSSPSGDPYNARGRAYRLGLNYQASRAPQSSAGIMSFVGTVGNIRPPRLLNTQANLDNILDGISAVSSGGTNYRPPLDTTKRWLTTGITSNPSKAIIFLSDGSHNAGDDYLAVLDTSFNRSRGFGGPMPRIFGIFMGLAQPDTANLADLSQRTGGQFYRIPPNRPDSLQAVVERILNIVLLQYRPDSMRVTNSSVSQSGSSTAFLVQADNSSWRVVLDNVIALQPGTANNLSITSQFREATSGQIQNVTSNFTLSTTGPLAGGTITIPGGFETRCYPRSRIQWLTNAGVRPAHFTEADSGNVRLQLRGSDSGLAQATPSLSTRRPTADAETRSLPRVAVFPDSTRFSGLVPMRVSASASGGNSTLEPFFFDSLIARWVHPRDPQDSARDTIPVRPGNVQAQIWFSTDSNGTPVTLFPGSPPPAAIWIVVQDNRATPGLNYRVTVSSDSQSVDQVTLNLVPIGPGRFTVLVPFDLFSSKNPSDNTLQISPTGDQLRANYTDPFYGDQANAAAGFGVTVQEPPALVFTDASGTPLPDSALWPLSRGRVFVRYTDDHHASLTSKPIQFRARSLKWGASVAQDEENRNLPSAGNITSTLRAWSDSVAVNETVFPNNNNGTLEGAWRMVLTATVEAHNNHGQPTGQSLTRTLVLAHPDSQPSLTFVEHVNRTDSLGPVDVLFTLRDQDFIGNAPDTVAATVQCPASGDSVSALRFSQQNPGVYSSDTLFRNGQTANLSDRLLSCPSGGDIVVRYLDPVYGNAFSWTIHEAVRPTADPASGTTFPSQTTVSLSTVTAGAAINYTVNATLPRPGQPISYSAPFQLIASDTVWAVASAPGYLRSWVSAFVYTRTPGPSSIAILDANGGALPNRTTSDAAASLQLLVRTAQGGVGTAVTEFRSHRREDNESPVLANHLFTGTEHRFWGNIALRGGAASATDENDTLETALPDTLIATWRNPIDPSDVVSDTAFIVAGFAASSVHFSNAAGGARVDSFPAGTQVVHVVVNARSLPGTYRVLVSSTDNGRDSLFKELTQVSPGRYSVPVTLAEASKNPGDTTLQVFNPDQLLARFVHPAYGDTSYGAAGYGALAQVPATLVFLDTLGNTLEQDAIYSPAYGRLRARYTDDYQAGIDAKVRTKRLILNLDAQWWLQGQWQSLFTDMDTLDIQYDTAARAWLGTVPIRDRRAFRRGNDTVETQFRGQLSAKVASHDNAGDPDGGNAERRLILAYPDQTPSIVLADPQGGSLDRLDAGIAITLRDQVFTLEPNARVPVRVSCEASGDFVDTVWLVHQGNGVYTLTPPLPKDELNSGSPNTGDRRLACRSEDVVRVDYVDPVYGGAPLIVRAGWNDPGALRLFFASRADSSQILSITESGSQANNRFLAIAEGSSPSRDSRDTLRVALGTDQGDIRDTIHLVETGVFTGRFVGTVPFRFRLTAPTPGNDTVDARLNPAAPTAVLTTGTVRNGSASATAQITLLSHFNAAVRGYARDRNGDGQVDAVYLRFTRKLNRLPSRIDSLFWNRQPAAPNEIPTYTRQAPASGLSLSPDSLTLIAIPSSPFAQFLTGIPSGASPRAVLPADSYFGGMRVPLEDSAGPVPVSARKLPSDLSTYSVGGDERRYKPDTLLVKLSEPMTARSSWRGLLRFSKAANCADTAAYLSSEPLPTLGDPVPLSAARDSFQLLADNTPGARIPLVGDCIFLEGDGRFYDLLTNIPGRLGVPLEGGNAPQIIRDMFGYPPVAGLSPSGNPYIVANSNDPKSGSVVKVNPDGDIVWIPPVGFQSDYRNGSYNPKVDVQIGDRPGDGVVEAQGFRVLPRDLSVVQVITSGRYIAHITLYDHLGTFVKSWRQKFGFNGELRNTYRITDKGVRSFLVWDQKDAHGQKAGQGVYVWKVHFELEEKKQELRITRTGMLRN